MDDKIVAYAVGIIGALGALLKVVYDSTAVQKKQDSEVNAARITILEDRVEKLHSEHADCIRKAASAEVELAILKARMTEVENDRDRLRSEVERLQGVINSFRKE